MRNGSFFPTLTFSIMYLDVLIFFLIYLYPQFFNVLSFNPGSISLSNSYTIITYMFLHSGISHLLGNMVVLIILGYYLEALVGKARFLSVYLISGIVTIVFDVASRILFNTSLSVPLVGASGAIMGIAAFLAVVRPNEKVPGFLIAAILFQFILVILPVVMAVDVLNQVLITVFIISAMVMLMIRSIPLILFVLIQAISMLWSLFYIPSPSISYLGHFGGLFTGLLLVFIIPRIKKN